MIGIELRGKVTHLCHQRRSPLGTDRVMMTIPGGAADCPGGAADADDPIAVAPQIADDRQADGGICSKEDHRCDGVGLGLSVHGISGIAGGIRTGGR